MSAPDERFVWVCRHPGDACKAKYRIDSIRDPHWRSESGGVKRPLPQVFLFVRAWAEALESYARQKNDVEMERWVAEIKLRAVRRIGELSRGLEASKGGANPKATLPAGGKSKYQILKSAGISTSQAHRAEQVAAIPAKTFERYIEKKAENREPVKYTEVLAVAQKEIRRADTSPQYQSQVAAGCTVDDLGALAGRGFATIYADQMSRIPRDPRKRRRNCIRLDEESAAVARASSEAREQAGAPAHRGRPEGARAVGGNSVHRPAAGYIITPRAATPRGR